MVKNEERCMPPEKWITFIRTEVMQLLNKDTENMTPVQKIRAYAYTTMGDDELLFIKAIEQIVKHIEWRPEKTYIFTHHSFSQAPSLGFERQFKYVLQKVFPNSLTPEFYSISNMTEILRG